MPTIKKSALVMYSAQQMYDIVVDIESYPEFLQWCDDAQILESTNDTVVAKVSICYKGINQSFTTRNLNVHGKSIEMGLNDTNKTFQSLDGGWRFVSIDNDGGNACKVEFELNFVMNNQIAATIFKTVFSQIVNSQVDGFVKRAQQQYS